MITSAMRRLMGTGDLKSCGDKNMDIQNRLIADGEIGIMMERDDGREVRVGVTMVANHLDRGFKIVKAKSDGKTTSKGKKKTTKK